MVLIKGVWRNLCGVDGRIGELCLKEIGILFSLIQPLPGFKNTPRKARKMAILGGEIKKSVFGIVFVG